MTTDITELATVLRLAAESEIAYRAEGDTSDLWQDEASPDSVLALVEALENAQQRIVELENYAEAEAAGADRAAEDGVYWMKRFKELESRTVKIPKLKMLEDYLAEVAIEERKQILFGVKLEFHRACVNAGIKVEAE